MTRWMKLLVYRSIQARLWPALRSPRIRAHISGVGVNDTKPEARNATTIVVEKSRKMRGSSPGMKTSGRKTAASESVIERMVKEISPALLKVAFRIDSQSSAQYGK